ncbi:nucleotidyltransferase domain-containing protein [Sphingomonas sp. Leaf23]|uniref:nucleotidyltransferase domain-containing protein n=1 Tax=Sphingomonas sp. Leaf23 TaxID=1735689 RepID=UPI0009ECAF42|nr:nucleotidyltransferase domain-containing protein [Sphingomonas sp. Leaf23]
MLPLTNEAIPAGVRSEIDARLAAVEANEGVRLLLTVESGSRAWGFPSPDSDYDVRFVYVRPRDWYLSLTPGRDVIEAPIVDDIDLSGWDIRKALGLLLKSNAVVSEWIESPIRYRPDDAIVANLAALADSVIDARSLALHYASLGRNAADRWLEDDGAVPVKQYFYALRPALAIRWLRREGRGRPPMDLQSLVDAVGLSDALAEDIAALVAAKRRSNERSNTARIPALDALIRDELSRAGEVPGGTIDPRSRERAEALFLHLVNT